ncbi:hypothetical protein C2E23DRAFT_536341 [Lenzites betulinus]|nr:hypothetical protein C2E23DRAFT_536341 [Lenzites betulinus]
MELLSLDTVASLVLHGDSTTASRTMQNTYRGIYVKPEHGVIKQTQSVRVVEVYQCYTVHINPSQAMIDSGFSNQPALDTFTVVLDTGSSVSWLVGRNCCLIYHNANGEMSLTPANFDKSQSPSDKTKSKVIKHSFTWDSEKNEGKVHDNAITGEIIYSDGSKTLLTLMQKPQRDVMFGDCFAWNEQASWTTQSKMSYQFGVAYATTPWLHSSCIAGVLGLDLTTYHGNNTFNGYTGDSIPTFTAALIEQRILKPGYSRVGSTQGITFFFAMRPKGSISSFFALNTWPCNTAPPWTPGISVIPTNNQWAVRLISIWFERKTVTSESTSSGWEVLPKSRYQFSASADSGVEVCLDTGSSLSWLPAGFVQHLRHVVFTESAGFPHAGALNSFLNAEGIPINITAHLTPTQVTYFGNECPPDQWRVGLCFKGYTQDYVDVYAPVNPFICTMNNNTGNSEGLICSPAKEDSVYILGINFFQAMFVAMHNVRLGQPRRAFVRMAPQWPSLHDDYTPPEPILDDC